MATTSSGSKPEHATADREIVISRVISAPRELVFEAFTQVRHLSRWWGPFSTTTRSFESVLAFEPAGDETRMVMRTVFPTRELRDEAVKKYHAIEGGEQTLRKLAGYVAELTRNGTGRNETTSNETTPKGAES
jgi:uncharacterized protein YndB with AHSA1/START domain